VDAGRGARSATTGAAGRALRSSRVNSSDHEKTSGVVNMGGTSSVTLEMDSVPIQ
jgi:hypothetical protein